MEVTTRQDQTPYSTVLNTKTCPVQKTRVHRLSWLWWFRKKAASSSY